MSKIKVLSENVSNRIAAGEVIERPASVVKELVENALDAGAEKISVNIEKGGSKLIVVTDNGYGMDGDDALLCLEPHATSKIFNEADINSILTFGFRGEAVPSIASVSRFSLRTRQHEAMEGSEVIVHGGKFIKSSPMGCAPGTEMIVRDLFFNVPARKKFLRTQVTEEKHIQETLFLLALPYPNVGVELIMDGRGVFNSPAHSDLKARIKTFFGKEMAEGLMPVKYSEHGVKVSGFIARHGFTRNTRREQRVFINGRPVEAFPVYKGIKEGYGSLIEKGRFPPVILFLSMDPLLVDVNVHPAKREVRFRNEGLITSAVAEAIRIALRTATGPSVAMGARMPLRSLLDGASVAYQPREEHPAFVLPRKSEDEAAYSAGIPDEGAFAQSVSHSDATSAKEHEPSPVPQQSSSYVQIAEEARSPAEFSGGGVLKVIGFLDDTYILATAESGLVVIDQHAAHERVLYERILKGAGGDAISQKLLLPITLEFSRSEVMFIEKYGNLFEETGFEIEAFGRDTVIVNAIPVSLGQDNVGGMISDLLSELTEKGEVSRSVDLNAVAMAACKAAVKANDHLTLEEANSLLRQMAECDLPFACPHGRPTVINISVKELEKRFGRR